jgi:hypothetical protein
VLHLHPSTLRIIAGANVIAAGVVVLTVMPNINESEIVGLTTALLVAWNTWRASKNDKVVKSIHTLTNSAMGAQLKLNVDFCEKNAVLARRLASITKEDGDAAAATAAEVLVEAQKSVYQDHLLRQAKVDATQD